MHLYKKNKKQITIQEVLRLGSTKAIFFFFRLHNARILSTILTSHPHSQSRLSVCARNFLDILASTAAAIINDKARILDHVKGSALMKATVITKQCSFILIGMEKLLMIWRIEDQSRHWRFYQPNAHSGKGTAYFPKFERAERQEYWEGRIYYKQGLVWDSSPTPIMIISRSKVRLHLQMKRLLKLFWIIQESGYLADQVLNVDETGLFWKQLPNRTYISKEKMARAIRWGRRGFLCCLGVTLLGTWSWNLCSYILVKTSRHSRGSGRVSY